MENNVSPCSDAAEKIATKFDAAIIVIFAVLGTLYIYKHVKHLKES